LRPRTARGNHPAACGRHPSQEGNGFGRDYVGAGFKPALPRPGAVRRLCEAPLRPRYVQCYRCEAIQCRGDNIRYVSQDCTSTLDCFAAYQWYVSQVRRRLRNDGQGVALPPSYVPRPGAPSLRAARSNPSPVPPSKPIPLLGGVPPAGGGVVPPAGRNPRPNSRL
jgi:hypothetical protein